MNNLEQLKHELLAQKTALEAKGGTVTVANLNPSPAEITAGINSIYVGVNPASATATESDVVQGKTFFALDNDIKTGTLVAMEMETIKKLFLYEADQTSTNLTFNIPESIKVLRSYLFYETPHSITVNLNENLVEVKDYAFTNNFNTTINNLHNCTKLQKVGRSAFQRTHGINMAALPMSITEIYGYAFQGAHSNSTELILPPVTLLHAYAFHSATKVHLSNIDISRIQCSVLNTRILGNLVCDCDFVLPPIVTDLMARAFSGFSAKHIVFPSSITSIETEAFSVPSGDTADMYNIIDFTFEGLTPPRFGSRFLGTPSIREGVKIYVPDEAFDAYYNANNATSYQSLMHPISEKE